MDQESFIKTVKEAFIALGATYACLDEEAPDGGMHEGYFRLFSNSMYDGDIEKRLPGIYWIQIVSPEIIEKTGTIRQVAKDAPCERIELIEHAGHEFLLMQITMDSKKANRKSRMAMRDFFKDSLYNLSLDNIYLPGTFNLSNWKYMSNAQQKEILRMMKMVPFTNEEIQKIFDLMPTLAKE